MRCVLCLNLQHKNKFLKALVQFRFLRIGINAVRRAQPYPANSSKFLWLINCVRFKNRPLFMKSLATTEIFFHNQLFNSTGHYLSFSDLALKFNVPIHLALKNI